MRDELNAYEFHADEFSQIWVNLHVWYGITNYLHMIGSGHMLVYMCRWVNLNKYSQQDWEALNALIKLFFFRRTNKGGQNSGEEGVKRVSWYNSKLLQRRFFIVCNLVPNELWTDDKFLEKLLKENEQNINVVDNIDDKDILD